MFKQFYRVLALIDLKVVSCLVMILSIVTNIFGSKFFKKFTDFIFLPNTLLMFLFFILLYFLGTFSGKSVHFEQERSCLLIHDLDKEFRIIAVVLAVVRIRIDLRLIKVVIILTISSITLIPITPPLKVIVIFLVEIAIPLLILSVILAALIIAFSFVIAAVVVVVTFVSTTTVSVASLMRLFIRKLFFFFYSFLAISWSSFIFILVVIRA